jgi:hypothetical protein
VPVKLTAALLLLALLWAMFRFAMGLRWAKLSREAEVRGEEARGRQLVAEIPLPQTLVLFMEDAASFHWAGVELRKADLSGARTLLNGAIVSAFGSRLPEPEAAEAGEARERWEVVFYLRDGSERRVACGSLREGVSREIATRIFDAARRAASGTISLLPPN